MDAQCSSKVGDDVLVIFRGHGALNESPARYELTLESEDLTVQ